MVLNILPSQKKTALAQDEWYKRIRSICIAVIAVFVVLDVVIIAAEINLNSTFNAVAAEGVSERINSEEAVAIEAKIFQLNESILAIEANTGSQNDPIEIIGRVVETTDDQTVLSQITIDTTQSAVSVVGTTKNRQTLAQLQNSLNESSYIDQVVFPVGDLQTRENIDFTFSATIIQPETAEPATKPDEELNDEIEPTE